MYPALNGVHPLLRNSLSFPRSNVTVFLPKNRTATSAHYRPVTWIIVVQDSVTRSDDARFRLPRGIQKNKIMPPMLHNDVLNNGEGHASPSHVSSPVLYVCRLNLSWYPSHHGFGLYFTTYATSSDLAFAIIRRVLASASSVISMCNIADLLAKPHKKAGSNPFTARPPGALGKIQLEGRSQRSAPKGTSLKNRASSMRQPHTGGHCLTNAQYYAAFFMISALSMATTGTRIAVATTASTTNTSGQPPSFS